MSKPSITINGKRFSTLDEFFVHFQDRALAGKPWGRNLDAFNDVLRGGFGTPDQGFVLIWDNHGVSRERLGYPETRRVLGARLLSCHPSNVARIGLDLADAKAMIGPTIFDVLVDIIRAHGPGGREAEDGIELLLN